MRWESVLDRRDAARHVWHPWFAWYPVRLPGVLYMNDGTVVWLEVIWRRREGYSRGVWRYALNRPKDDA